LVAGLVTLLEEQGWDIYVDWRDATLPAAPSRETAETIQGRIRRANYFLFLATQNSLESRWCPWEIGYADGAKPLDSILVIPTQDANGTTKGSEYLGLYRRIDFSRDRTLGVWRPGETTGVFLRTI
jgi:TIR domain